MSIHTVECHSASERKETVTCHGVGGPWKYHAKGERPEAEGHMSPVRFHLDGMLVGIDIDRDTKWSRVGGTWESKGNRKWVLEAARQNAPQSPGLHTLSE